MPDNRFFHRKGPFTVSQLAEICGGEIRGDGKLKIEDVASLSDAVSGNLTFLTNMKYKDGLAQTKASVCIVAPALVAAAPEKLTLIVSPNPHKAYAQIAQAFYPLGGDAPKEIHETAVVHKTAKIGKDVSIGAYVVIGENVEIGDGCVIDPHVTITHALVGKNCRIFPGVKIGQDGFGFAMDPKGQHVTIPQLGRVIIEDRVEIGANTTIDRGAGPDTIVGAGTRIDNLVQIGHNVKIGKNCVIVAQVGIAGSTVIEDFAVIAAQSGIAGHLTIGMGAQIAAKSGVAGNVPAGGKYIGIPAKPMRDFWQEQAILKRQVNDRKASLKKSGVSDE